MSEIKITASSGRAAALDVIASVVDQLDVLGLTEVWATPREYLKRAGQLDTIAEELPPAGKRPGQPELVKLLAEGLISPADPLITNPNTDRDVAERTRLVGLYRAGADSARMLAVETVKRRGDRLVADLRPAVTEAVQADDGTRWESLCSIADQLRQHRLLPALLGDRFSTEDYRLGEPHKLPDADLELSGSALLAAAKRAGARPGIFDAATVYERAFPRQSVPAARSGATW